MKTDPIARLPSVFGEVLTRYRRERKLTAEAVATAAGLSSLEVRSLETGYYGPTLKDFFRLAMAFGEEPAMFLVNVVEEWRADPADTLRQSRASDFARLFRLGYLHGPGDFRELLTSYDSVADATRAAEVFNAQRHTRGVALLDAFCVYVRLDAVPLRPDKGQCEERQP